MVERLASLKGKFAASLRQPMFALAVIAFFASAALVTTLRADGLNESSPIVAAQTQSPTEAAPPQTAPTDINQLSTWLTATLTSPSSGSSAEEPNVISKMLVHWSSLQAEKFTSALLEQYRTLIRLQYEKIFTNSPITVDTYLEVFSKIQRILRAKEFRFREHDESKIDRLALKVYIVYFFGDSVWDRFKTRFDRRDFWATAESALRMALVEQGGSSYRDQESQADARANEAIHHIKIASRILKAQDPREPIFSTALKLSHLFQFGFAFVQSPPDSQATPFLGTDFIRLSSVIDRDFEVQSRIVAREFIDRASSGKLRHTMDENTSIRFAVIHSNGRSHLITRVQFTNRSEELVIINPPHTLSNGGLSADNRDLWKYLYRQRTNLVVADFRSGSLQVAKIMKKDAWWSPSGVIRYLKATYANPTWGTVGLAIATITFNVGIRASALAHASNENPEIHFSTVALAMVGAYVGFCAAFGRWYDNLIASKHALSETGKKILFAVPFTSLGFMWLTLGNPWLAFIVALPMATLEKLGSTYSRRLIRFLEKEQAIRGSIGFTLPNGEIISAEKGLVWRELESYMRNLILTIGTTINPNAGLFLQILWGEVFSVVNLHLIKKKKAFYQSQGDTANVAFYDRERENVLNDFYILPGLRKGLKKLGGTITRAVSRCGQALMLMK